MSLERDLVDELSRMALSLNAMLAVVGQRKAKGSGSSIGFPDLVLICSGEVVLIEVKRRKDAENPGGTLNLGQQVFIEKAAAQGVTVHVVDSVEQFVALVNWCRRPKGVRRSLV